MIETIKQDKATFVANLEALMKRNEALQEELNQVRLNIQIQSGAAAYADELIRRLSVPEPDGKPEAPSGE